MMRIRRNALRLRNGLLAVAVILPLLVRGQEISVALENAHSLSWMHHDRKVKLESPGIPVRDNREYVAAFSFDTRILDQVPNWKLRKLDLDWSAGYTEGEGESVIELRPLKAPIDGGWTNGQVVASPADIIDFAAPPIAELGVVRPGALENLFAELPMTDVMLAALNRGVGISLRRVTGGLVQVNVNSHERNWKTYSSKGFMRLHVTVETDGRRLTLEPLVKIRPDEFVAADGDGDLVYCGRKLHLSGVNLGGIGSYAESDGCVARLSALNVNAVRLWEAPSFDVSDGDAPPRLPDTAKGDGSSLDRYDYRTHLFGKAGIFLHCAALGNCLRIPAKWKDVGRNGYWCFPETIERQCEYIRAFLAHVNPYTGLANGDMSVFATYELFNEDSFISDMMGGCFRKWTPEHQVFLKKVYCRFLEKKYGSPVERDPGVEGGRRDFLEFVMRLQMSANSRYERVARECGKPGRGVAVAPFVHGTHCNVSMNAQFVHQRGQGASTGVYQCLASWNKVDPFYPYSPYFSKHPAFYNLNFGASDRKFFMVYEHHPHGPYKYRAEWMPQMTMVAAGNAWDALYLYSFYLNSKVSGDFDLACAGAMVPEPYDTSHYGYCEYFKAAGDEILCGGLAVCGQAFMNGLKPHRGKTVVTYGKEAIFNPAYQVYSPEPSTVKGGAFAELSDSQVSDGDNYKCVKGMYNRLYETSFRHQLSLDFDETQDAPINVKGELYDGAVANPGERADYPKIESNDEITWDPPNMISKIDASHSKIAVGILPKRMEFKGGVSFEQETPLPMAFFGLSTRDGKLVSESREMLLNVVSTAENTGYRLDTEKMQPGVLGLIPAIITRGTTPVVVTRPSGVVTVPGKPFKLERYNFARFLYKTEIVKDGKFRIEADEPLFLGRIVR
ncbi:MAG: hypothetical protein KBT68_02120 [bacterium]|nr:hypothetical protein [Candidatus Colisoma equi]